MDAKGLKPRGINECGVMSLVDPIQIGGGGGVLARIEGLRDLLGDDLSAGDGGVDEGALAHARGPQNQGHLALERLKQDLVGGVVVFQGQGKKIVSHGAVNLQTPPRLLKGHGEIGFVEHDEGFDLSGLGRDQGAGELGLGELGLSGDQNEQLINVGGKRFGAQFILTKKFVAPRLNAVDGAFVFSGGPPNSVSHQGQGFFTSGATDASASIGALHHHVPAVTRHDQAQLLHVRMRAKRSVAGGWE